MLSKQGLPFRGHLENEGNYVQLLLCRSEDVEGLKQWVHSGKYMSHEIINEVIEIMAHELLRGIISNVKCANYFALIVDETQDVSRIEQLSVSIRWVDNSFNIHEDFAGLMAVEKMDGASLASLLKDVLLRCDLPLNQCRGQAYDGAANMSGCFNGVASRLRSEVKAALYVHCTAHCLNLCLQDCARKCSCVRDALGLVMEISNIIRNSPKRLASFKTIQKELCPNSPDLKPLCPTRWTVLTVAIAAVLENYSAVIEELHRIGESHCETSARAVGNAVMMERFSTFFGLKLSHLLFSAIEQVATTLQYKDINAQEAAAAINSAKHFLERQRSEEEFDLFYDTVRQNAIDNKVQEPTLPRQRRVPQRVDSGAHNHVFSSPKEYYRCQYYEVLDLLKEDLLRRFDQPTLAILKEIEDILIKSCNGTKVTISPEFTKLYSDDINITTLLVQLSMLPDVILTANSEHSMGIKEVTKVCNFAKTMLGEIKKLLHIYLTIPLTSATAERSFSLLRRLKNYLRSTMTQNRLNHLLLLHVHKRACERLNIQKIAIEFVSRNERRLNYFGHY